MQPCKVSNFPLAEKRGANSFRVTAVLEVQKQGLILVRETFFMLDPTPCRSDEFTLCVCQNKNGKCKGPTCGCKPESQHQEDGQQSRSGPEQVCPWSLSSLCIRSVWGPTSPGYAGSNRMSRVGGIKKTCWFVQLVKTLWSLYDSKHCLDLWGRSRLCKISDSALRPALEDNAVKRWSHTSEHVFGSHNKPFVGSAPCAAIGARYDCLRVECPKWL